MVYNKVWPSLGTKDPVQGNGCTRQYTPSNSRLWERDQQNLLLIHSRVLSGVGSDSGVHGLWVLGTMLGRELLCLAQWKLQSMPDDLQIYWESLATGFKSVVRLVWSKSTSLYCVIYTVDLIVTSLVSVGNFGRKATTHGLPYKLSMVHGLPYKLSMVHRLPYKLSMVHGLPYKLSMVHGLPYNYLWSIDYHTNYLWSMDYHTNYLWSIDYHTNYLWSMDYHTNYLWSMDYHTNYLWSMDNHTN
jgi:hypothetical protein